MAKKKKGFNAGGARLRVVYAYIKSRLGYASDKNVSLFELACRALERDGFVKPPELSCRKWTEMNGGKIIEAIAGSTLDSGAFSRQAKDIKQAAAIKKKKVSDLQEKLAQEAARNRKDGYSRCDVNSPEFLQSYEWRQLRMRVLVRYGSKCMCCGATPETGAVMNVDHIKPRRLFPQLALDEDNAQILCGPCNHGKGNQHGPEWDFRPKEEYVDPEVLSMLRDISRM